MKRIIFILILFFCLVPTKMFAQGRDRKSVALVLGGGGAKGAAEIGVLKYIEKSGVPIDYIVGTSIGSIVGGLYSVGYRSEELDSLFRSQHWLELMFDRNMQERDTFFKMQDGVPMVMGIPINLNPFSGKNPLSDFGVLKGDSIVSLLGRMIDDKFRVTAATSIRRGMSPDSCSFDSLPIPFRSVAVDVTTLKEMDLNSGNLARAIRASMAIPFVFRPMEIEGKPLVDGGVLNNLPVDVAKALGADIVIAVDLSVNTDDDGKVSVDSIDTAGADEYFKPVLNSGLLNMMKWTFMRPDIDRYKANLRKVDVYIHPELKGYGTSDFKKSKISEMIAIGEEAGKQALEELEKLKKSL